MLRLPTIKLRKGKETIIVNQPSQILNPYGFLKDEKRLAELRSLGWKTVGEAGEKEVK